MAGHLSYSLYLWQTIFFVGRYYEPSVLQTFPTNALMLLACACLSYYLVERPLIAYGHRLSKRRRKIESEPAALPAQAI